jgi:acetyl-CoA carboxylase carboxyltransferase component
MEEKNAKLFVNTPNALEGNTEAKCDSASAKFQSEDSGIIDFVGSEQDIFDQIRQLVTMLPSNNEDDMSYDECTDDLNRVCAELENCIGDTSILISNIADDNVFVEVKAGHAKSMVTGFIKLNGVTVGCVANRTQVYGMDGKLEKEFEAVLCPGGCEKAADFVNFCDAFNIPILSFTNTTGFKATVDAEKKIAKAVAKLTYAFAHANVGKVNVVIGKAFGSAYVSMNSKSIGADMVFAWPTAEIGMMDAKLAAKIMYANEDATVINEKATEYSELQSSAISAAKRGYVDSIIEAKDTRKYVIGAFEMLFTKREDRPGKKHGTV